MKIETDIQNTSTIVRTERKGSVRTFLRSTFFSPLVCAVVTSLGIFGGIACGLAGTLCIIVHTLIPNDKMFDRVGTILLIVTIPAILVGSVFVDEIQQ